MAEMIPVRGEGEAEFPAFFCIAAITRAMKQQGIEVPKGNPMAVTFTVNGVELPFMDTLNNLWERANNEIDERVMAEARNLVTRAGLEKVADALEAVETQVHEALEIALAGRAPRS